jgi:hypothetical protein
MTLDAAAIMPEPVPSHHPVFYLCGVLPADAAILQVSVSYIG